MGSVQPSKKILFLIVACVIGIGAVSFAVYATKNNGGGKFNSSLSLSSPASPEKNSGTIKLVENALQKNSQLDNDADGLLNWEETLWGADQNNPDSDNDGAKDGEEAKQNRNPLKPGPDDKLSAVNSGINSNAKTGDGSENNAPGAKVALETTQTAKIGRDLFASYLEAKRSGVPLNAETQKLIIQQAFANKSIGVESKQYATADIATTADSDYKKYGNDLGQVFNAGATKNSVSEIEILNKALTEENPAEIAKLDPIIDGYGAILNKLAIVATPRELVGQHLELLNSVSRVLANIKSFRLMFEDPMVGLAGVSNYYKDIESFKASIGSIKSAFDGASVAFGQNEYGYIFVRIIE